jgi:polar amino acid transport system substrate-binding protein
MQIAVQSGTTGEDWAKENLPKATIVPLDDIIQAMTGVQSGLYNACVADLPVTQYEIKIAYSDLEIPDGGEIPTGEQYGAVINKNNTALLKAVNKALKDIKADGTQDSIEKTWFGSVISS